MDGPRRLRHLNGTASPRAKTGRLQVTAQEADRPLEATDPVSTALEATDLVSTAQVSSDRAATAQELRESTGPADTVLRGRHPLLAGPLRGTQVEAGRVDGDETVPKEACPV